MVKLCSSSDCDGLAEFLVLPMRIYVCKRCLKIFQKKYGKENLKVLEVYKYDKA